jgi:tRNA A-37 threonylcarbamoyl transferase component Bud32/tetratricopeptide (TPR) repeat protein
MRCPEPSALQAFFEGHSSGEARATIRQHLEGCADCRAVVLALAPTPNPTTAPTVPGYATEPALQASAGQLVGRFIVLHRLGEGGMGVVYAAYDPDLDRKVALKLIRRAPTGSDADARQLQERLMREAQAMARVAHPNVVAVHEVGRHQEQVFIAMELIDGEPLAAWLAHEERSTARVVDVFVQAGRGLVAAHSAGLVHRDFKPSNVMIDGAGRVRVMDFGLARPTGEAPEAALSPRWLDETLTAPGAVLGTPAYMAPEQLSGEPADARTDQFSFCVALYEALCGIRPFAGENTDALRAAIVRRRLQRPRRRVPGWLMRIVERGLGPAATRWPSMEALLAALLRDPWRRRRRMVAALGVAGVLGVGALAVRQSLHAHEAVCAGAGDKLAGVWAPSRRAAVAAAFAKTGAPYAPATFTRVAAALDRYAQGWVGARVDACQATRVRGEQSEELLDLRMLCLDDRLDQLRAVVDLFTRADGQIVEHAVSAAAALAPLADCADAKQLRERVPPPRDPATRTQVEALSKRLNEERALFEAGKDDDALVNATALEHDATALGYMPLASEVHVALGMVFGRTQHGPEALAQLEAAALDAQRGHDDEMATRAWCYHARVMAERGDDAQAQRSLAFARASLDRRGRTDAMEILLQRATVFAQHAAGHFDAERAAAERLVELDRKVEGAGIEADIGLLAWVLRQQGFSERALELNRQEVAGVETRYGGEHPYVVEALLGLGVDLMNLGRAGEALPVFDRALGICERIYPPGHPRWADVVGARADTLRLLHRYDESIADNQRVVAQLEKLPPPIPAIAGEALKGIGLNELDRNRPAAAIPPLERALSIFALHHAPPLDAAETQFALARALYVDGQRGRARTLARAAGAAYADKHLGQDYAKLAKEVQAWLATHS